MAKEIKGIKKVPRFTMDKCIKCKINDRRKNHKWCNSCHAEYMRNWRKTHTLNAEQKAKDSCRSYAGVYKRRGKLKIEPCTICGSGEVEMHHEDYSKPLNVTWLCKTHHQLLHN